MNDPRRGRSVVSADAVLDAFDQYRRTCASDTEAARRVARHKRFGGEKVSRATVLRRVRERREGAELLHSEDGRS